MKNIINSFIAIILLLLSSCNAKDNKSCKVQKKQREEFVMYKNSEMANLMRLYLEENKTIREMVINGEEIGKFPDKYLDIHKAVLTDPDVRDKSFDIFAKAYIRNVKDFYTSKPENRKSHFNTLVKSCVACHQTTCPGPISTIEKLLIR